MTSEESTDQQQRREHSELEQRFLDGYADEGDDEFDEELLALVENRQRGSVLRPILMILVIVVVSSVIYDWRDEIEYFFADSQPLEIGDTTRFSSQAAQDPDWEPPVAHNRYVSIGGMPTRVSRGGGYEFFRLVGAEIYVQRKLAEPQADRNDSGGVVNMVPERSGPGVPIDEHRRRYEGKGRLVAFGKAPDRVRGLKEHYGEHYNLRFCEDYSPRQIEDFRAQQIETLMGRHRQRYEEASEERRQELGLSPEPREAEISRYLDERPVCVDAYLVHDGQRPSDQWWYLVVSVLLGLFVLYTAYKLVRWFQAWLK